MNERRTAVDGQDARLIHERVEKIGLVSFPTADSESVGSVSAGMANSVGSSTATCLGIRTDPAQWAQGVW